MKRYLGLDLGTKTCGVALTDKSNTFVFPHQTIHFDKEDYENAFNQIKDIVEKEKITDIVIGLPKNMDGSLGFASQRSLNFVEYLKGLNINVTTFDERLSSVEAQRILHDNNLKSRDFKDKVDMQAAAIILESYLRSLTNDK